MNVVEMHQWFDQLEDKVDSIYFNEFEKDLFINRAIQIFINNIINKFTEDREGRFVISSALEESLNVSEVLKPLMLLDLPVVTDVTGVVTDAEIVTAIETEVGDEAAYLHVLSVVTAAGLPVKFVRENDYHKFQQNDFKVAIDLFPQYRIGYGGVFIAPVGVANYAISVIKEPKKVNYSTLDSTDLPETTHDYIMASALELAGLASRDEALLRVKDTV